METGMAGRFIGIGFAVVVGVVATYICLKSARGARERALNIRWLWRIWVCVTLLVILVLLVPSPFGWGLCFMAATALGAMVNRWTREKVRIRTEEEADSGRIP